MRSFLQELRWWYQDLTETQRSGLRLGLGILALLVFVLVMAQCSAARAGELDILNKSACRSTLADAKEMLGQVKGTKVTTYSGIEGARIIGFLYAQDEIHGFPRADSIVVADGPHDATAVIFVNGECVSYATMVQGQAFHEALKRILPEAKGTNSEDGNV